MRKYRFLAVNDDPDILSSLERILGAFEGEIVATRSWIEAMQHAAGPGDLDLLLVGARIGGASGPDLIREARLHRPALPILVLAPNGQESLRQESERLGAEATLPWPVPRESVTEAVTRALRAGELDRRFEGLPSAAGCTFRPLEIVDSMDVLEKALSWTETGAERPRPILITGNTGTQKPFLARALHHAGRRRGPRFVTRLADGPSAGGGTLFLDDVEDLSPKQQEIVLRLIQDGVFDAGTKKIKVDVQVIAATRKDLAALAADGRFRPELERALTPRTIRIPPLVERRERIPLLAERLSLRIAEEEGRKPPRLSGAFRQKLVAYDWPGNLGELRSVIERAALLAAGSDLDLPHLPSEIAGHGLAIAAPNEIVPFVQHEQAILRNALQVTGGKIPEAARRLAIGRATLYRKVKKYNLR
ncbi:MAG: sigma-54-dependent Fis family transcriptional regulator [Planctomycetes bacterium]|nr:sigma-54-dependent Fis family transcriptional regulator [Planctomycetota bacterium]